MKLYYKAGACSLSPRIVLHEAGLPFDSENVDLATKQTDSGADFRAVNPNGYVPALVLDSGEVLTEGPAIVQYLADQAPDKRLAPPAGSIARYQLMSLLNFISTELHKSFSPLFRPDTPEQTRQTAHDNLARRFEAVAQRLKAGPYLMGPDFTVADAYLFTVLRWTVPMKVDLSRWPELLAYMDRVASRPAVQAALREESLA
jgi:glutathione S-transferase